MRIPKIPKMKSTQSNLGFQRQGRRGGRARGGGRSKELGHGGDNEGDEAGRGELGGAGLARADFGVVHKVLVSGSADLVQWETVVDVEGVFASDLLYDDLDVPGLEVLVPIVIVVDISSGGVVEFLWELVLEHGVGVFDFDVLDVRLSDIGDVDVPVEGDLVERDAHRRDLHAEAHHGPM